MSKPLAERYRYYDTTGVEQWSPLSPVAPEETARRLGQYTRYLSSRFTLAPTEPLEASDNDERLARQAVAFIERTTGLTVTCGLRKYERLNGNHSGIYHPGLHAVAVSSCEHVTTYGNEIEFGSLLVHEMMHSTAVDTSVVLDINNDGERGIYTLMPHQIAEITPGFDDDHFFEEGLAEEIASRWRVEYDATLKGRDTELLAYGTHAPLPLRMYSPIRPIDQTTKDTERILQYPAFCSYGIQLLSDHTGVDIIDLLIQARKPETQVSASKALKNTVDAVEPGLYDILCGAGYTQADFEDCLVIIKTAIAHQTATERPNN